MSEPKSKLQRATEWFVPITLVSGAIAGPFMGSRGGGWGMFKDAAHGGGIGLVLIAAAGVTCVLLLMISGIFTSTLPTEKSDRLLISLGWVYLIAIYIAVFVFFGAHAAKGLSQGRLVSADVHFDKCRVPVIRVENYQDPQRCADGWRSPSRGSGRCSHHGGVSNRSERIERKVQKPEAMCWEKALNHSWID